MSMKTDQQLRYQMSITRDVPFFSTLTPEELGQVERLFRIKHYAKEQVVLYEEDTSEYMYLIYSGRVRVVKMSEDGKEQIITIHKKNDFFGEMSLLDGKTSPATIIAHEDAVIGLLGKSDFDEHLLRNEGIYRKMIELLCNRLQELHGVKDDCGVTISVKMTHQQMASYASVTRETISRVMRNLEKTGEISILENKLIHLNHQF
jgi:CRP-like cAMP-binding protein